MCGGTRNKCRHAMAVINPTVIARQIHKIPRPHAAVTTCFRLTTIAELRRDLRNVLIKTKYGDAVGENMAMPLVSAS